jgi:osmotically-inducible protein OsmY
MKKNAIMVAGILFAAGASEAQQDSYDRFRSPSETTRGSISAQVNGENYEADAEEEFRINDSERDTDFEAEHSLHLNDDISADSSVRGGSLDARGYRQYENNDEIEGVPDPLNPGKKADSSVRGGSIHARERNWNHDAEPSSGSLDPKQHMKADSSIRGGSLEARGGREAMRDSDQAESGNFHYHYGPSHDEFGRGSSATWQSDQHHDSIRGSANWNPEDDLLRDGMDVEAQSTIEYERNNDTSVGGAARSESGSATLDDVELDYAQKPQQSAPLTDDLNSSEQLEENISGQFDIENQGQTRSSDFRSSTGVTPDPNSLDTSDSSVSSSRSTDIVHDQTDIEIAAESTDSDLSSDIAREGREATGAAAESESGQGSSSDEVSESQGDDESTSFESNDPALNSTDSAFKESDRGLPYTDNRARGVGSLATGEFGAADTAESGTAMSDENLAREVKGKLTRESTGTHGLMQHQVARNIQVTAENGEITLKGTVPSEKDKRMVEIRAAEMPGVTRVKNELRVTPEADAATRDLLRGHNLEDRTSGLPK